MSIFKRLSNASQNDDFGTTRNFFVGTPEAEGESTSNSKMKLGEIFADFLNVFPELQTEKFIITGRKGSGKSAIAEFLCYSADNDPMVFAEFIKTRDIDINKITQLGKEKGFPIEEKLLFEWLILTKIISLFTVDQSLQSRKEMKDLRIFLERNSGIVDIKNYEITEIVYTKGFNVNIEYFKRAFTSMFKKDVGINEHRAAFYRILPHLREVVLRLLQDNLAEKNENQYILIFDDLDIGFKESNINSIESITNILRVAKDYNIEYFGKKALNAKVIILLRDDLKRIITKYNADTAKIFSSYEIPLIWYEQESFKANEDDVALKKLINKRFQVNFDLNNLPYDNNDIWGSLIDYDYNYYANSSSFKYIVDHTFFRPRDLILFFKPLPQSAFSIPLTSQDIQKLLNTYIEELVREIKNELTAIFSSEDIENIFRALKALHQKAQLRKTELKKSDFLQEFQKNELSYDHELTIMHLFDYSLIGNLDRIGNKVYFKHRERPEEPCSINFELSFTFHKAIHLYFLRRT